MLIIIPLRIPSGNAYPHVPGVTTENVFRKLTRQEKRLIRGPLIVNEAWIEGNKLLDVVHINGLEAIGG